MSVMNTIRVFWDKWKRFGQVMGDVFARVILTIFYFTVLVPFGIGVRIFGDVYNQKQRDSGSYWNDSSFVEPSLFDSRRQF